MRSLKAKEKRIFETKMDEKKIEITIALEGHAAAFIAEVTRRTGTPANEVVSAIVNGHRIGMT